jgi:transketolase
MRTAFIKKLHALAKQDSRITLLVGDLGFGVVTDFAEDLPDQFCNVGVAEQNMTGLAAGMALSGKIVFTYSIGNFPTLRCLEQVRNDVCYHNATVKIVPVGGGLAYGALGSTHHATEDIAIMRALPNMTVVAPGDPVESAKATAALAAAPGPAYLRLGRAGEPEVHTNDVSFELGRAIKLRDGGDVTLIATGSILYNTLLAAERLEERGIHARVLSMHTIKPLDAQALKAAAGETAAIVTLEEHSIVGGLGGAVLEALSDLGAVGVPVKRVGLPPEFISEVGKQTYLWELHGLSVDKLVDSVETFLSGLS